VDASPTFFLAYVAAVLSSGYFFYLGRNLPMPRRIAASLHGVLAAAILPSVGMLGYSNLAIESDYLVGVISFLCFFSGCSIIYSLVVIRGNWRVHLWHIATVIVLQVSFVMGLLLVLGT
jgi:hypothetical protein